MRRRWLAKKAQFVLTRHSSHFGSRAFADLLAMVFRRQIGARTGVERLRHLRRDRLLSLTIIGA